MSLSKTAKGWIVIGAVVAVIIAGMLGLMAYEYSKTVTIEFVADPGLERIELIAVQDERNVVYAFAPGAKGPKPTVTVPLYEKALNIAQTPVVRYYRFIMTRNGERFQSDTFNFYDFNTRVRFDIGIAGSWKITDID